MRRIAKPELLDYDAGTPREIAVSLADLRRINRWFGGVSTTLALLRRVIHEHPCTKLSLLEAGSGSGDVPQRVQQRLAEGGVTLTVTLLDRVQSHLPPGSSQARRVVGDALVLPFADNSVDVVSSSLFVHHLEPPQVTAFLAEALRVCRLAVIINDLRRSALSLVSVYAGFPLLRSRLSRHDGPVSVRRAYTVTELSHLLGLTNARRVELIRHYLFRLGAIVWK
jgi:hypothetical protein